MNYTSIILTVGTALRHAESRDLPVEVLLGTEWLSGQVVGLDGEGVVLLTADEETIVIRIGHVAAVRLKAGVEETLREEPVRREYDFGFPGTESADDLVAARVTAEPPRYYEPAAQERPVVSPYPVGHPARSGR